jgi:hypothetical protein
MKWLAMKSISIKTAKKSLPFPESLRILLIKRSQSPTDHTIEPTKETIPRTSMDESYGKPGM